VDQSTVQGSDEWLLARKRTANASETPSLFGENPFSPNTPKQLWDLKHDKVKVFTNDAMKRGNEYEDEARSKAELDLDVQLSPMVFRKEIDGIPFSASLDGCDLSETVNVEIKCPAKGKDSITWGKAESGDLGHYRWQVQTQMLVSGIDRSVFFVYDADTQESVMTEVVADKVMQQQIVETWSIFWQYMESESEPPLTDKDYQDKDGDEDFEIAVNDYLLASHDNKRSKIALDDAKKRLADLAGETNAKGYGVTVTKVVRKGSIDYAKVPDLNGVDLEEYRKKGSEYWKVTLSEEAKAAEVVAAHYGDSK